VAQTYYDVLGVAENATKAEIEAAFKSKAREVHPDRVAPGSPYLRKVAGEAFKDLSEAKSVLLDPVERQKYDSGLAYMRGAETSSTNPSAQPTPKANPRPRSAPQPQTSPNAPPAAPKGPQTAQKPSFWKPANTNFAYITFILGGIGFLVVTGGIITSDSSVYLGVALTLFSVALLSWRHGSRPATDAAFTGGSVILFIFAAIFFGVWLQPSPPVSSKPTAASIVAPTNRVTPASPSAAAPCGARGGNPCLAGPSVPQPSGKNRAAKPPDPARLRRTPEVAPTLAAISGSKGGKPIESSGPDAPQNTPILENSSPTVARTGAYQSPKELDAPHPAPQSEQAEISALSVPERQSIESACSSDKYNNGPAAYNRCLGNQLALLRTAPQRPDLSGLSIPERQSIESACSSDKYNNGPAAYNRCLGNQLGLLRTAPQRPDLSSLSGPERQSIESACSSDKYNNGPAAYNRCLLRQLGLLKNSR
jgi:curved DNA-binding protein CbpA